MRKDYRRECILIFIIGFLSCMQVAHGEHHCSFPAALPPGDIKTKETIEDYGALRLPVPPTGTNASVERFRSAVQIVRDRDNCIIEDPSTDFHQKQKKLLSGYLAIRAIHGIDVYEDSPKSLFNMRLATLFTADAKGCESDRKIGRDCGLWNRCVHSDDGGSGKIQDLDYEHYDAPLFLIWHRAYVRAFEITLRDALRNSPLKDDRKAADSFGIPYWPWAVIDNRSVPAAFTEGSHWCTDTGIASFRNLVFGNNVLLNCNRSKRANSGVDVVGLEATPNPFKLIDNDFSAFSNELENSWHAFVHQGIGGDMGASDSAAEDPLFWVHHSFIDFLFDRWLKKNKEKFDDSCNTLRLIWNKKQFKFPVVSAGDVVWYEPSLDELGLCLNRSDTLPREKYSFSDEGVKGNIRIKSDADDWVIRKAKSESEINSDRVVDRFVDQIRSRKILAALSEKNACETIHGKYRCVLKFQNPGPVSWLKIDKDGLLLALELSAKSFKWLSASRGGLLALIDNKQSDRVFFSFDSAFISEEGRRHMPYSLHLGLGVEDVLGGDVKICEKVTPRYIGVFTSFGLPYRDPSSDAVSAVISKSSKVLDVTAPLSDLTRQLLSNGANVSKCASKFVGRKKFLLLAIQPLPQAIGEAADYSHLKPLGFSSVSIVFSGK